MADPQRRFQIIQGGSGRAENSLIDTGTVGQDKPKLTRPKASSGGGRGGGSQAVSIAELKQSVGWLWKVVGGIIILGISAFVGSFFILDDRIQDRFDKAGRDNTEIVRQLSDINRDLGHLTGRREAEERQTPPPAKETK